MPTYDGGSLAISMLDDRAIPILTEYISMETKKLNAAIDALGKRNAKIEADIQALGLACLGKIAEHGDVMPINRLLGVLRRGQHKAFTEWALAYGALSKNKDKTTLDKLPLVYDKARKTDIEAATATPWTEFAESKADAVAKAFDLQAAVMALLKRAAKQGVDHDKLVNIAKVVDIAEGLVPATETVQKGEPALI